jgi:hypothetical protein
MRLPAEHSIPDAIQPLAFRLAEPLYLQRRYLCRSVPRLIKMQERLSLLRGEMSRQNANSSLKDVISDQGGNFRIAHLDADALLCIGGQPGDLVVQVLGKTPLYLVAQSGSQGARTRTAYQRIAVDPGRDLLLLTVPLCAPVAVQRAHSLQNIQQRRVKEIERHGEIGGFFGGIQRDTACFCQRI